MLSRFNSTDYSTLTAFQTATGVEANSLSADPLFKKPAGDAGTNPATAVDLHLSQNTSAEGAGTLVPAVTDDFDGQPRSGLTPVDLGADAGDFGLGISLPALSLGSTANRVLTGWAVITSPSSPVSGGANAPRLYFKKATEADAFLGNTAFRNTNASGAAVAFLNGASNNTVKNCVLEGSSPSPATGVVFFSTGVLTGNDNNTVTGCQIRDRSDAAGVPAVLVCSAGTSDAVANSNNTISNNELVNFSILGVYVLSGSDNWSVTGNTIYETAARTTDLYGIALTSLGTNSVNGNTVYDLTTSTQAAGIALANNFGSTTVSGNRMWNLGNVASSTGKAGGIVVQPLAGSSATVVNSKPS